MLGRSFRWELAYIKSLGKKKDKSYSAMIELPHISLKYEDEFFSEQCAMFDSENVCLGSGFSFRDTVILPPYPLYITVGSSLP